VITNAAAGDPQVKALVYVDAFIPDQGGTLLDLVSAQPGPCLGGNQADMFNLVPYPSTPQDVDTYIKASLRRTQLAHVRVRWCRRSRTAPDQRRRGPCLPAADAVSHRALSGSRRDRPTCYAGQQRSDGSLKIVTGGLASHRTHAGRDRNVVPQSGLIG
jgi:hypothetical protein